MNSDRPPAAHDLPDTPLPVTEYISYLRAERGVSPHTVDAYRTDLCDLCRWMDNAPGGAIIDIGQLQPRHIRAWMMQLAADGCCAVTIRRKLSAVQGLCRYMMAYRGLTHSPAHGIRPPKVPKPLPVFVPEASTASMLDSIHCQDSSDPADFERIRDELIMLTLYSTGIRCSELIGMTDGDVDTSKGQIKILGKRSKERFVPFGIELNNAVTRYRDMRDTILGASNPADPFFVRRSGLPLYPRLVYQLVHDTMAGSGIHVSRMSPHVMRHSFATDMLSHGANLSAVQQLLGHESLATTQIYTHVALPELQQNYRNAHPRATLNHKSRQED